MEATDVLDEPDLIDERDELRRMPVERLESRITELAGHIFAAECQWLAMIAEFDRREGWKHWGCRSCAHWLGWHCGIEMRAAREKLRVAHALDRLPRIRAEFANGTLSYSKVRAVTRVATPQTEEAFLHSALHSTAGQLERIVRAYRSAADLGNETEMARRRHRERHLRWHWDDDGSLVVVARLTPEVGALVIEALEAAKDALDAPVDEAPDDEPGGEEGSAEPSSPGAAASEGCSAEHPSAAMRADALELMAESFLANGPRLRTGGDRYLVVVHADVATLSYGTGEMCELDDGPALASETLRRLACDCSVVGLVKDAWGKPIDISRKQRTIPASLRRAVHARDRGCRAPGCTATRGLVLHHVRHWARGGATSIDNLVELCEFHHHLVHEGGFHLFLDDTGAVVMTTPSGERLVALDTTVDPLDATIAERNEARGVHVEPGGCQTRLYDTMDLDLTLTALFSRTPRAKKAEPANAGPVNA